MIVSLMYENWNPLPKSYSLIYHSEAHGFEAISHLFARSFIYILSDAACLIHQWLIGWLDVITVDISRWLLWYEQSRGFLSERVLECALCLWRNFCRSILHSLSYDPYLGFFGLGHRGWQLTQLTKIWSPYRIEPSTASARRDRSSSLSNPLSASHSFRRGAGSWEANHISRRWINQWWWWRWRWRREPAGPEVLARYRQKGESSIPTFSALFLILKRSVAILLKSWNWPITGLVAQR